MRHKKNIDLHDWKLCILFGKHLGRHIENLENSHVTLQIYCGKLLDKHKTKPQD